MKSLLAAAFFFLLRAPLFSAEWATYEAQDGPGKGKRIVLLAGDEEYRSEEGLPQLAKILSQRHGFACQVVFSVNPDTGDIDPNQTKHQPGLEALASADLCVMLLRFRQWPDGQMQAFADYVAAGKPIIALRTSTHAFRGLKGRYETFNDFGKSLLGEGWVSHWGKHKAEATRGVLEPSAKDDPLLRGVALIFGTSDVYEAHPPIDAQVLLRGQVLQGIKMEDMPADYRKARTNDHVEQGINDPMMPIAWTRSVVNSTGKSNQILCTTMGAATDLSNEGLRRLLVNAAYSFTGLEVPAKANVELVGPYEPTMYSANGFIKGKKPADYELTPVP